jgi:hypothetical protein
LSKLFLGNEHKQTETMVKITIMAKDFPLRYTCGSNMFTKWRLNSVSSKRPYPKDVENTLCSKHRWYLSIFPILFRPFRLLAPNIIWTI